MYTYMCIGTVVSEDEARLRLKRWLVVGGVHPLDEDQERQSHIKAGGRNLEELASSTDSGDFGHAELDRLIRGL